MAQVAVHISEACQSSKKGRMTQRFEGMVNDLFRRRGKGEGVALVKG